VGATIRCESADLVRFALMGHAYARGVSKIEKPRIGLLNVGHAENRGGETLAEAHRKLRSISDIDFVGNVEGHEVLTGRTDVLVCEGLLGNVVLKMAEGLAEVVGALASTGNHHGWRWRLGLAILETGVGRLNDFAEFASYGGAPILGFQSLAIVTHPSADVPALTNAVKIAAKAVRADVVGVMRTSLAVVR
jgi:glycerol-3-phosphate acyltransferase PlsX